MAPTYARRSEDTEWAWWLRSSFMHEVGIRAMALSVVVGGMPRFLGGDGWWRGMPAAWVQNMPKD